MAKDWIDSPDYDRWKTDPEWKSLEDKEREIGMNAYKDMEAESHLYVMTDFSKLAYHPGSPVKWLGPDREKLMGVVIGAIDTLISPGPTWVILSNEKIVQVDEVILLHEWEEPKQPVQPQDDCEIPF